MVLKTSPVPCLIAAPVLAVLLLELSPLLNSDKIGGKANTRQMQHQENILAFTSYIREFPLLHVDLSLSGPSAPVLYLQLCFVPCQHFSPSLSPHIQDVSFTKQEPAPPSLPPPLKRPPVCVHLASMRKLSPPLCVNTGTTQKLSLLFVLSCFPTRCFS